ncbi:MAG: diacylglycerol kinase family lipid kinase [Candidatus Hydrogenedentes bacterium]|nr:diacylglycerol kinase family lipid kinase [Candidatus Hydrogenedentota bacterium]
MKVAVILNAAAGSSQPEKGANAPDRVRELFAALDCEAVIYVADGETIVSTVRRALDSGVDAVVAGGGDGTISSVVRGLIGRETPLGVLPLGTLNHFAKDAGIPFALEDAVRTVVMGVATPIDLAEVNGVPFINNSSVGAYTALVQARDALQKQTGQGKWSAMLRAGLRVFRRFRVLHVRLEVDGAPIRRRTPIVFVGNNEYQMELFKQGSRAKLDSGHLSLYIANSDSRWRMIRLFCRFVVGRLEQTRDFESRVATEVWIEHRRRSLHVSVDGEVFRLVPPLHYRIRPLALKVILPLAAPPAEQR